MPPSQILYLNFQKGPPRSVRSGEKVRFSARISNDLKELDFWPSNDGGSLALRWFWVADLDASSQKTGSVKGKEREGAPRPQLRRIGTQEVTSIWQGPSSAYTIIELAAPAKHELGPFTSIRLAGLVCSESDSDETAPLSTPARKNKRVKIAEAAGSSSRDPLEADLIFSIPRLGYAGASSSKPAKAEVILPLLSDSIEVAASSPSRSSEDGAASKLSQTTRLLRLSEKGGLGEVVLQVIEQSGFDLDKHIWDAALFALDLIQAAVASQAEGGSSGGRVNKQLGEFLGLALGPSTMGGSRSASRDFNVVELGSGTSLVLIGLLALLDETRRRATSTEEGSLAPSPRIQALATDLDSALPIIERNLLANSLSAPRPGSGISVSARALDWEDEALPSHLLGDADETKQAVDLVLVSDCTYNPSYFKPLCQTIARLLRLGRKPSNAAPQPGSSGPMCLLTKKHRHEDEERLWDEVKAAGLRARLIAGVQGWMHEGRKLDQEEVEGRLGAWIIELA